MTETKSEYSWFKKIKQKFGEIYLLRIVPAMNQKRSGCKTMGLSISLFLWIILCMGLLFTIYYTSFDINVNFIIKNENDSYVAAVIDYKMFYLYNYEWATLLNLYQYVQIIGQTAKYMVDIVVFPECGLFMCGNFSREILLTNAVSVPSAEESVIACDFYIEYDEVISRLSCAAKENKIYVTVNVMEKFCLGNCSTYDDMLLYNTDVVFDRSGKIIARYRKYNLYLERWVMGMNQTKDVELTTFTTDFNETFGIMICFDGLFEKPGVTLVREKHVTSMINSAAYSDNWPFLAAPSAEAGWSYALDVNVLVASLPISTSYAGTNIFFGRNEQLSTYMTEYRGSKIIIGVVPRNGAKCIDVLVQENGLQKYSAYGSKERTFMTDYALNSTTTKSLFDSSNKQEQMGLQKNQFIYHNRNFKCTISVMWKNGNITEAPNFQLLGYSGPDSYTIASVNNYVEMCGLVLCSSQVSGRCENPTQLDDAAKITFVSLNIVATSNANTSVTIPTTLNSELLSFTSSEFSYSNFITEVHGKDVNVIEMNLKKPSSNLISFGIYTLPLRSKPMGVDAKTYNSLVNTIN